MINFGGATQVGNTWPCVFFKGKKVWWYKDYKVGADLEDGTRQYVGTYSVIVGTADWHSVAVDASREWSASFVGRGNWYADLRLPLSVSGAMEFVFHFTPVSVEWDAIQYLYNSITDILKISYYERHGGVNGAVLYDTIPNPPSPYYIPIRYKSDLTASIGGIPLPIWGDDLGMGGPNWVGLQEIPGAPGFDVEIDYEYEYPTLSLGGSELSSMMRKSPIFFVGGMSL